MKMLCFLKLTLLLLVLLIQSESNIVYAKNRYLARQSDLKPNLLPLFKYLKKMNNFPEDIEKFIKLINNKEKKIIFEIGCGNGVLAWKIAKKNPDVLVLAIDIYEFKISLYYSGYNQFTEKWQNKKLLSQQEPLPNLCVARATSEILSFLPDNLINSTLFINPTPQMIFDFFTQIHKEPGMKKFTPKAKIILKPYTNLANCFDKGFIEQIEQFTLKETSKIFGINILDNTVYKETKTVYELKISNLMNQILYPATNNILSLKSS